MGEKLELRAQSFLKPNAFYNIRLPSWIIDIFYRPLVIH